MCCRVYQLYAVLFAGLAVVATGCANQPGAANPFLAADRVPPPQTRLVAPTQPYYQNDITPIPQGYVPQGAAPGFAPGAVAVAPQQMPVAQPFVIAQPQATYVQQPQAAYATQATFAQQPVQQFAVQPQQPAAPHMDVRLAAVPSPQQVTQPDTTDFTAAATANDNLPWVSGSAPRGVVPSATQGVQPATYLAPAPRVRLPGYPAPQQTFVAPQAANQSFGGVQITELQPTTAPLATQPAPTDGFRPRTSARPTL